MNSRARSSPTGVPVPKLTGFDVELGNFIPGVADGGSAASQAVLREVDGIPAAGFGPANGNSSWQDQDWGRKFLPDNGGSIYIDLKHVEIASPEVTSAPELTATFHAMLRIVRRALRKANASRERLPRIQVQVNNSDGHGHSWGGHQSFLVSDRTWESLVRRRLHLTTFLASYQVSSIVFTGQGKVGSENGAPPAEYQISQRADFFEELLGEQTTWRRPIVNARDESLAGSEKGLARLHVIFYDSALCHVASTLRTGAYQIVLAMLEAGRIDRGDLILQDPLAALIRWSHDPDLRSTARLLSGRRVTAVQHQEMILAEAGPFVESGACDEAVPGAAALLELWRHTIAQLAARDFASLAGRLDWVLKKSLLEGVMRERGLDWKSPEIKHLDLAYGDLETGLYWEVERAGVIERLVSEAHIQSRERHPPPDTRARLRSTVLRQLEPWQIDRIDWDAITFRSGGRRFLLSMADPLDAGPPPDASGDGTGEADRPGPDSVAARELAEPPPAPPSNGPAEETRSDPPDGTPIDTTRARGSSASANGHPRQTTRKDNPR